MSDAAPIFLLLGIAAQWFTAAASIWLTWWAAQSRDALALRVSAMALVIVPALFWPTATMWLSSAGAGSMTSRAFLYGIVAAGIAALRALFLGGWSAVSRDSPHLRIGGAVIALLEVAGLAMQGIGLLARW